jgi:hypothetical protein
LPLSHPPRSDDWVPFLIFWLVGVPETKINSLVAMRGSMLASIHSRFSSRVKFSALCCSANIGWKYAELLESFVGKEDGHWSSALPKSLLTIATGNIVNGIDEKIAEFQLHGVNTSCRGAHWYDLQ